MKVVGLNLVYQVAQRRIFSDLLMMVLRQQLMDRYLLLILCFMLEMEQAQQF